MKTLMFIGILALTLFPILALGAEQCTTKGGCNTTNNLYCNAQVVYKTKYVVKKVPIEKLVERIVYIPVTRTVVVEKWKVEERLNNRLRLLGGVGYTTTQVSDPGSYVSLDLVRGPVFGLGYDRLLTKHWSIGAAVISNKTYLLNVGFDF